MQAIVKAAQALSDETRIRILNLLLVRECCVCEVMQALKISQTRASRNLNVLYNAGFLALRREGLWAYYSIKKAELEDYLVLFLDAVERGLMVNKAADLDRKQLEEIQRSGPQCYNAKQLNEATPERGPKKRK
jgi:ArsR family transcriptional regulator